jgi:hypothetical protein
LLKKRKARDHKRALTRRGKPSQTKQPNYRP